MGVIDPTFVAAGGGGAGGSSGGGSAAGVCDGGGVCSVAGCSAGRGECQSPIPADGAVCGDAGITGGIGGGAGGAGEKALAPDVAAAPGSRWYAELVGSKFGVGPVGGVTEGLGNEGADGICVPPAADSPELTSGEAGTWGGEDIGGGVGDGSGTELSWAT